MTNNRLNGCTYCMAAHTTISQGANVPADVIESLRSGSEIADSKLKVMSNYTTHIMGPPVDRAFLPNSWSPSEGIVA